LVFDFVSPLFGPYQGTSSDVPIRGPLSAGFSPGVVRPNWINAVFRLTRGGTNRQRLKPPSLERLFRHV
jgi:hypothetical protein